MTIRSKLVAGVVGLTAALLAAAAFASVGYDAEPDTSDNTAIAGVLLLLLVGAIMINNGGKKAVPEEVPTEAAPEDSQS